jgi:hypothetical protein
MGQEHIKRPFHENDNDADVREEKRTEWDECPTELAL